MVEVEIYPPDEHSPEDGITIDMEAGPAWAVIEGFLDWPDTWAISGFGMTIEGIRLSAFVDENLAGSIPLDPDDLEQLLNAPCNIRWT